MKHSAIFNLSNVRQKPKNAVKLVHKNGDNKYEKIVFKNDYNIPCRCWWRNILAQNTVGVWKINLNLKLLYMYQFLGIQFFVICHESALSHPMECSR